MATNTEFFLNLIQFLINEKNWRWLAPLRDFMWGWLIFYGGVGQTSLPVFDKETPDVGSKVYLS